MTHTILLKLFLIAAICVSLTACQHTPHALHNKANSHTFALKTTNKKITQDINKYPEQCSDYLKLMGQKPLQLEFIGCNASFHSNTHELIANYKVKGKDVLTVQEQLHRSTGMPRLVKDCCKWESKNTKTGKNYGVLAFNGTHYKVAMQSSELRLGWNIASDIERIPFFHVYVIRQLSK